MKETKPIVEVAMRREMIDGYSTKYALTKGIYKVTVNLWFGSKTGELPKTNDYVYTTGEYRMQLVYGKTFFENIHDAEQNAREQAARKCRSLRKQLQMMDSLALKPKMATDG